MPTWLVILAGLAIGVAVSAYALLAWLRYKVKSGSDDPRPDADHSDPGTDP